MEAGSKSDRLCCYRCSRCQLEVYRHYIHYDRRDRPICDPDCDGTKPGVCIWCEQVIVGRPMLMFEKKVHRECWQYCVAKFGYDEIIRRYTSEDWEKFREREVGEDMVREMVEEYFDKFCNELVSDDEMPSAEDMTSECLAVWEKKGDKEWAGGRNNNNNVLLQHGKKHASLPNITCVVNDNDNDEEQQCPGRGSSEGESGSGRSGNAAEGEEPRTKEAKMLRRLHDAEERTEWLQAVQKSVCGDSFFDRESWADEAYRRTVGRNDVTMDRRRHGVHTASSNTIANTYEGQRNFVDNIIEEAVTVVQECNEGDVYKTVNGKQVVNYDKVWERSTRKRNAKLTRTEGGKDNVHCHSEDDFVRLSTCEPSLVDKLIDEAVACSYVESSDDDCLGGVHNNNLRACRKDSGERDLMKSVFSKSWDEARAFRVMYENSSSSAMSTTGQSSRRNVDDDTSSKDVGGKESTATIKCDDKRVAFDDAASSETALDDDGIDDTKTCERRRRRDMPDDDDDGECSTSRLPSGHETNPNDLVYEFTSRKTSKSDVVVDVGETCDAGGAAENVRSATNIAESGVENILTEDQLDELFGDAMMTSANPMRLGRLVNEFKEAVASIQHNANTCKDCPKPSTSTASENDEYQSTRNSADQFETVLAQLVDEVEELRNSILIFRKFARPDHFCETSVYEDMVSSPQGEVYGTGNVLIIFDYGDEPLESDPASVYEYLANIYQDRDSPRCFLHRSTNERFDFTNFSEGNISMYDGTDDAPPSTYRDDDASTSSIVAGAENMSAYDEELWRETHETRSNSTRSLHECYSAAGLCTDVEAHAWSAMLNAGKNEDVTFTESFVEMTKNLEENSEKDFYNAEKANDSNYDGKKSSNSVSGRRRSSCDEGEPHGNNNNNKISDVQLLDRLRSIKRINFDESVTNLGGASTLVVVRKSVSESDVSAYEMYACTTADASETSFGSGGSGGGGGGINASETENVAWKEVRKIITRPVSRSGGFLQHTASLGADAGTTDVYQVAVEITINKRTDMKGTKRCGGIRRTSSVDILSFFPDTTTSESLNESKPEFKETETIIATDGGVDLCQERIQSEIVISKEAVEYDVLNDKVANSETAIDFLAEYGSRHEITCPCYRERTLGARPVHEFVVARSERKAEDSIGLCASDKSSNIDDNVSNITLISKESRHELLERSSRHGSDLNKSSKIDLSGRNSNTGLYLEGRQCDVTALQREHPSEFNIDVDLYSSDHFTDHHRAHHSTFDDTSSNDDEDLFGAGFVYEKYSHDETSSERTDVSEKSTGERVEENQVGFPKMSNANIVQETVNKKVISGQEDEAFDNADGSSGSAGIVDPRCSDELGGSAHYKDDVPRKRSNNKDICGECLIGGGEVAAIIEKSYSARDLEFDTPAISGRMNIESGNYSCRQAPVERGISRDDMSLEKSVSRVTGETERNNVGEDGLKLKSKISVSQLTSETERNNVGEDGLKSKISVSELTSETERNNVGEDGLKSKSKISVSQLTEKNVGEDGSKSFSEIFILELTDETERNNVGDDWLKSDSEISVSRLTSEIERNIVGEDWLKSSTKISISELTSETEQNVGEDASKTCEVRSQVVRAEHPGITSSEEDMFIKLINKPGTTHDDSLRADVGSSRRKDDDFKILLVEDVFVKSSHEPRSLHASLLEPDTDRYSHAHADDDTFKPDVVLERAEESVIDSVDYLEMPLIAEVSSKRCNLNILRQIRENYSYESTLEYDIENEEQVEKEIGCMCLCDDYIEFKDHTPTQNDSILNIGPMRKKSNPFDYKESTSLEQQPESDHYYCLSHREIDNEISCRGNVLRHLSSTTTGSEPASYQGHSTEEELEVFTLGSTSEYDLDHRWPSQCGSNPGFVSDDADGVSVLGMIRNRSATKRVAGDCGDDEESSRDTELENVPVTDKGEIVTEADLSNTTGTSLVSDESKGECSNDDGRDATTIEKKAEMKSREEKNRETLTNKNLDEIRLMDEDEAKQADEKIGMSESTLVVKVVPPSGKKSKRKKEKVPGSKRKGSKSCVIL